MKDEVADVSNREQVVICMRWVDDDFHPQEDFIGLHQVGSIASVELVAVLRDTLLCMNLNIRKCRGQCYDGASNRVGVRMVLQLKLVQKSLVPFLSTAMDMPEIWQLDTALKRIVY